MKTFLRPLQELSGYEDIKRAMDTEGLVSVTGCMDAQKPHMMYALGTEKKKRIIVTFQEQKA